METGAILTIGSLFFMILLLISYYGQERTSTISSKIYRIMMITLSIYLVAETVSLFLFAITWVMFGYLYFVFILNNLSSNTVFELIKNNKICKYHFGV